MTRGTWERGLSEAIWNLDSILDVTIFPERGRFSSVRRSYLRTLSINCRDEVGELHVRDFSNVSSGILSSRVSYCFLFLYIIMSVFNLFTSGSIHQGDKRFSGISRGRQCGFISFSALSCAQAIPIESWTTQRIDEILIEGDRLYYRALESGVIPDAETISLNYLPAMASWSIETEADKSPIFEATKSNQIKRTEIKSNQMPIEATKSKQSPIVVAKSDLPIVVEPIAAQNNQCWLVNYKDFYQGRVFVESHENETPYSNLRSALMNTFAVNSYAFVVLEGYIMAIIKTLNFIFLFDSHARNSFGMPDINGTAVVMKYSNIGELEQYLYSLSAELNVELFEIVPVAFEVHGHLYSNCEMNNCNKQQSAENSLECLG